MMVLARCLCADTKESAWPWGGQLDDATHPPIAKQTQVSCPGEASHYSTPWTGWIRGKRRNPNLEQSNFQRRVYPCFFGPRISWGDKKNQKRGDVASEPVPELIMRVVCWRKVRETVAVCWVLPKFVFLMSENYFWHVPLKVGNIKMK